jgi:hypothetical protein
MLRCVESIFTARRQGAISIEWLSVGCHPGLIYDAAAAAKTILDKAFGRSLRPDGVLAKIRTTWNESLAERAYDFA